MHMLLFRVFMRMVDLTIPAMNMLFYLRFLVMRTSGSMHMLFMLMFMFMVV